MFHYKYLLFTLLSLVSFSVFAQQIDYDTYRPLNDTLRNYKYVPLTYIPLNYSPISTGEEVSPYQELVIVPTVSILEAFLRETKSFPFLKSEYQGKWDDYVDIAARYLAKNKRDVMIGKKPAMKFFQEDWNLLRRHMHERDVSIREKLIRDSIENRIRFVEDSINRRERYVEDSVIRRDNFVRDSTDARNKYLADSLRNRKQFVDDSLYRARFRKQNNYDEVLFDGPHGNPIKCYRKGELIEERTYRTVNNKTVLWKCKKNGVITLAHYSFTYIYYLYPDGYEDDSILGLKLITIDAYRWYGLAFEAKDISLTLQNNEYTVEENGKTILKFSVNQSGRHIREVIYDDNRPSYYNILTWYSNGKIESVKTYKVLLFNQNNLQGQLVLSCNFFSDGLLRSAYQYCKGNNGGYILRRSKESHPTWGGYEGKLFDLNGNYERAIDWKVNFSAPDPISRIEMID